MSSDSKKSVFDTNLGFGERAFSAAGAAAISAVLVNPLDIAKVEQSAYMLYNHFLLFSAIFLIDRYRYNGMGRENFNLRKKTTHQNVLVELSYYPLFQKLNSATRHEFNHYSNTCIFSL